MLYVVIVPVTFLLIILIDNQQVGVGNSVMIRWAAIARLQWIRCHHRALSCGRSHGIRSRPGWYLKVWEESMVAYSAPPKMRFNHLQQWTRAPLKLNQLNQLNVDIINWPELQLFADFNFIERPRFATTGSLSQSLTQLEAQGQRFDKIWLLVDVYDICLTWCDDL